MDPIYILLGIMTAAILLARINRRAPSPVWELVIRWIRWAVFAFGCALLTGCIGLGSHPFWIRVTFFGTLWFLCVTFYNWIAIKALNESTLPLFPKYDPSASGESWPTHPRFLKMREQIRALGFAHMQSATAKITSDVILRVSFFQNASAWVRLKITFMPRASGTAGVCASFSSRTASGRHFITDNVYMPFAGFFPENWFLERHPWKRSLARLLRHHEKRLAANNEHLEPQLTNPVDDLNAHQNTLDRLNTELGFLTPPRERKEHGLVTGAGRYRVWKELWMLNYLGRPARYE